MGFKKVDLGNSNRVVQGSTFFIMDVNLWVQLADYSCFCSQKLRRFSTKHGGRLAPLTLSAPNPRSVQELAVQKINPRMITMFVRN